MKFLVNRGDLRTALARLQPHAGTKDKEGIHPFGRIRFSLDPDDKLVMWTSDQLTRAVAVATIEFQAAEVGSFDLAVEDIAVLMAALKPMGSAETKSNWYSADFLITVTDDKIQIAEHWKFHPVTKELSLPRLKYSEDPYPDIPAAILSALQAPQIPVSTINARQEVFARITRSKYDALTMIGIARQAVLIGGEPDFTAVIPCQVTTNGLPVLDRDIDFSDLSQILGRHVRRPSLPTDQDSEAIKHRFGWERGFEIAINPVKEGPR